MVPENLREVCGPTLATLGLLLDEIRLLLGVLVAEDEEAGGTTAMVAGTGIPATQGWSLT